MTENDGRSQNFLLSSQFAQLLALAAIAACLISLWTNGSKEANFGIKLDEAGVLQIRDFAGHLANVKAIWAHGPDLADDEKPRPGYTAAGTLAMTERWLGRPVEFALPVPHTPTLQWLWLPLVPLPMYWAYVAWTGIGFILLVWLLRAERSPPLLGPLMFLSPLGIACFALGQTAFATTAALFYLAERCRRGAQQNVEERTAGINWLDVFVLWALTSKPNLALTAGAALIACGQVRTVVWGVVATIITTAAATPWLGLRWPLDYIDLMTHYSRDAIGPVFSWSINPDDMTNFRAVLAVDLNWTDKAASGLSTAFWLAGLAGIVLWRRKLSVECAWSLAVLDHLLFCPHVSCYEELQLFVVMSLLWRASGGKPTRTDLAMFALMVLLMWSSPATGPIKGIRTVPLLFLGKVALAVYVWARVRPAPKPLECG